MGAPRAIGRPVARSNLGVKQLVTLLGEWESGDAAYAALAARIRLLIDDGRIATYTRLPAERILADALGRSRTTVVSAYGALREAGYLVSVRGSGSVAMLPRRGPGAVAEIDFAHAVPEPVPGLEAIIERVTSNVPDLLRRPGLDLVGDPLLRRRIADRYTDRGLPTTPAQIVVTLGGQHAIALVARTLLRRADRVVVETPTYPHAYEAIAEAGGRLVSTPVTAAGWDPRWPIAYRISRTRRVPRCRPPTESGSPTRRAGPGPRCSSTRRLPSSTSIVGRTISRSPRMRR